MTAPVELTYGTIRWWVFGFIADTSSDGDTLPDLMKVNGRAFVTFDVAADGLFVQETTTPATILKMAMELSIVNGRLQDKAGNQSINLLANDSPGLSQTGWSYTIRYELDDGLTFGSFSFYLTTGEVKDLSLAVPLGSPSPGVVITKGDKGDAGAGFNFRGPWTTATTYAEGDVVTSNGSVFIALSDHVSGGAAPTLAAPGANMAVLSEKGSQGIPGPGVPVGGAIGALLRKVSGTDFDAAWVAVTAAEVGAVPAFPDPNADRLVGWDDSAGSWVPVSAGTGLTWSAANALTVRVATEGVTGIAELATTAETTAGTDDARIVTPLKLKDELSRRFPPATEVVSGIVQLATAAETSAGQDSTRPVTPLRLAEYVDQELSTIPPNPDLSKVPVWIFQASDGSWAARTTVTNDTGRPVEWIGYPGRTDAPVSGGSGAAVGVDFYRRRDTA